jgi:thiol-disulfide isomerase/thioredoxin
MLKYMEFGMSKIEPIWKIFVGYILILIFMIVSSEATGQIVVTHFNAEWNDPNKVSYIGKLTDCDIVYVDIAKSPKLQTKHEIVVVPTVVIFKDGEEMKRFQADISFSMKATRKEMQSVIDELIMSDF